MSSDTEVMQAIGEQYGAAFKMLEDIIVECDDKLWQDTTNETIINLVVHHVIYAMDRYLTKNKAERDSFQGKYGPDSGNFHDKDRSYSKEQLTSYLREVNKKADNFFNGLTIKQLNEKPLFDWHGSSLLSSLLYDLRHTMLHIGALHVRVNQPGKMPLRWVSKVPEDEDTVLNDKAVYYIQNGNVSEAEKIFIQLSSGSDNPDYFYNLACCYSLLGKLDQCMDTLKKCLQFDTTNRLKNLAKSDTDFTNVRKLPAFEQLINS